MTVEAVLKRTSMERDRFRNRRGGCKRLELLAGRRSSADPCGSV